MPLGPGKYDDLCTYVREKSGAMGACVMVFGGDAGWGFSIQAPPHAILELANVLRNMAEVIERDTPKDVVKFFTENPNLQSSN